MNDYDMDQLIRFLGRIAAAIERRPSAYAAPPPFSITFQTGDVCVTYAAPTQSELLELIEAYTASKNQIGE